MNGNNTSIMNQKNTDTIKIELGDWLYNAGIIGFLKILSEGNEKILNKKIIHETYIEITRKDLKDFTDKFFEYAFKMHGKFDSIKNWLKELKELLDDSKNYEILSKKYKAEKKNIVKVILEEITKRWNGVTYESFKKIKKSDIKDFSDLKKLVEELLEILENKRDIFIEKEVQTFLRGIIGGISFLNVSITKDQKYTFKKDFEIPIIENQNKEDKNYNCIFCNSRKAKTNTIFSAGLVPYQGLNKDSINFSWGFNPKLPLCEICELIYLCHWAGYTKSLKNKTYLFVNDDSSIKNLWDKNILLTKLLQKDTNENFIIDYFYELLLMEKSQISTYTLQNLAIIETNLEKDIMPKIISLHISRNQARYIKNNHEKLKLLANKFYKIKDFQENILREFLNKFFEKKLDFNLPNKLLKYYLQSSDDTKTNYIQINYESFIVQQIILLITEYLQIVKQKPIKMEQNYIWHIYHLGNDMRKILKERKAENKINGIAYRLLNAVRTNDKSTFMNVILRVYIGYDLEVPKSFVNTLESAEMFQIIGHSFINGLLGSDFNDKSN